MFSGPLVFTSAARKYTGSTNNFSAAAVNSASSTLVGPLNSTGKRHRNRATVALIQKTAWEQITRAGHFHHHWRNRGSSRFTSANAIGISSASMHQVSQVARVKGFPGQ